MVNLGMAVPHIFSVPHAYQGESSQWLPNSWVCFPWFQKFAFGKGLFTDRMYSRKYFISHKNTGMDCHALLQGIFLPDTPHPHPQRLDSHLLCFLHWHADTLPLAPPGKPLKITGREREREN